MKDIFNNVAANDNRTATSPGASVVQAMRERLKKMSADPAGSSAPANDNPRNPDRELLKAAEAGDLDEVKFWLERGADVNARHQNGDTPLIIAVRDSHAEVSKHLITRKDHPTNPNLANNQNETALTLAAKHSATQTAVLLLKAGAKPNMQDDEGRAAVHYAAVNGDDTTIKALADAGANLDLPRRKGGETPLILAVRSTQGKAVATLIDAKVNIDAQDNRGTTALMRAVDKGSNMLTQAIAHQGADIEKRNKDGQTAIDVAYATGHDSLAHVLEQMLRDKYDAFHTGTKVTVPTMKPLSLKPQGDGQ